MSQLSNENDLLNYVNISNDNDNIINNNLKQQLDKMMREIDILNEGMDVVCVVSFFKNFNDKYGTNIEDETIYDLFDDECEQISIDTIINDIIACENLKQEI
eukprot:727412_1